MMQVRQTRIALGLTQETVARFLGIHRTFLSQIERERRPLPMMRRQLFEQLLEISRRRDVAPGDRDESG